MIDATSVFRFVDTSANSVHVSLLTTDSISNVRVWIVDQDMRVVRMLSNKLEIKLNLVLRRRRDVNLDITGNVVSSKRK